MELVTILTLQYAHQSAIVRAMLEAHDIPCHVADEMTINANPFYSNAVGGVKIQVARERIVEAVKLLKENGYFPDFETGNEHSTKCPHCGSKETRGDLSENWSIIRRVLSIFVPVNKNSWHCFDCQSDFYDEDIKKSV
jgi:hypothetical protein